MTHGLPGFLMASWLSLWPQQWAVDHRIMFIAYRYCFPFIINSLRTMQMVFLDWCMIINDKRSKFNMTSLWFCDVIWRYNSGSEFAQIMACFQELYLNQCRLLINVFYGIHIRDIFQEIFMVSICKKGLKITLMIKITATFNKLNLLLIHSMWL